MRIFGVQTYYVASAGHLLPILVHVKVLAWHQNQTLASTGQDEWFQSLKAWTTAGRFRSTRRAGGFLEYAMAGTHQTSGKMVGVPAMVLGQHASKLTI